MRFFHIIVPENRWRSRGHFVRFLHRWTKTRLGQVYVRMEGCKAAMHLQQIITTLANPFSVRLAIPKLAYSCSSILPRPDHSTSSFLPHLLYLMRRVCIMYSSSSILPRVFCLVYSVSCNPIRVFHVIYILPCLFQLNSFSLAISARPFQRLVYNATIFISSRLVFGRETGWCPAVTMKEHKIFNIFQILCPFSDSDSRIRTLLL